MGRRGTRAHHHLEVIGLLEIEPTGREILLLGGLGRELLRGTLRRAILHVFSCSSFLSLFLAAASFAASFFFFTASP